MAGGPCGVTPEAASKKFNTLWRYSKNFKFLKEVKILSEFFLINLDAQSKFMSAEATTPQSLRLLGIRSLRIL
jgi:hypothetical protein